nr:MAG TPA: hypothetical protein [Caudoviricetes sp.]
MERKTEMEIRIVEDDKLYTDPAEWLAHSCGVSRIVAELALEEYPCETESELRNLAIDLLY